MIYGIGVDLLRVERMAETHARYGERLERRMLHPAEREALRSARNPANFLAKCFAAKEAFVKAMGTGFNGIAMQEVGLVRNALGRPSYIFAERLQAQMEAEAIVASHVSLTDDDGFVCAMAVLER